MSTLLFTLSTIADQLNAVIAELRRDQIDGSRLDQFLSSGKVFPVPGQEISFNEVYGLFRRSLPVNEIKDWPKARLRAELKYEVVPRGRADQPKEMIVGLSFKPPKPKPEEKPPVIPYLNPDYDVLASMNRIRKLLKSKECSSYAEVAIRLNTEGSRTKRGNEWTARSALQVGSDSGDEY